MDKKVMETAGLNLYYGSVRALYDINMQLYEKKITALIGPSGCGKSTFLRTLNRMNDRVRSCRITGEVKYRGKDIYAPDCDATDLRIRVGMVFQKPNPFPMSIYDNIAYAPRLHGIVPKKELDDTVEEALRCPLGGDKGQAEEECARAFRRSAAEALYRPRDSRTPRCAAHG